MEPPNQAFVYLVCMIWVVYNELQWLDAPVTKA